MIDPKVRARQSSPPSTPKQPLTRPAAAGTTDLSAVISDDEVRNHAYQLYERRGGAEGKAVDDWLTAEAHLRARKNRANKIVSR